MIQGPVGARPQPCGTGISGRRFSSLLIDSKLNFSLFLRHHLCHSYDRTNHDTSGFSNGSPPDSNGQPSSSEKNPEYFAQSIENKRSFTDYTCPLDSLVIGEGRAVAAPADRASECCLLHPCVNTGILWLFGSLAVVVCFGLKYDGNGQLVAVLGAALLAGAAGFSFARALFSIHRANVDLLCNSLALVILLTAGTWMAWQWGPLGAAYGMLTTNVATSLIKAAGNLIDLYNKAMEMNVG